MVLEQRLEYICTFLDIAQQISGTKMHLRQTNRQQTELSNTARNKKNNGEF